MIEVVYNGKEVTQETNMEVKTPRNVRQVGEPPEYRKIYIDNELKDYLKSEPKENDVKYGVLLGNIKRSAGVSYIFAKAFVKAEVIENSIIFNDEIWASIYRDMRNYYQDLEIIGWYVQVKYKVKEDLAAIKRIHMDNFAGTDRICYLKDRAENEEGFYVFENGNMNKQKGYFTYFDKNKELHSYIENQNKNISTEGRGVNKMAEFQSKSNKEDRETGKRFNGRIPDAILGAGKEQTEKNNETTINKSDSQKGEEKKESAGYLKYMQPMAAVLTIALVFSTVIMMNNYNELKNIKDVLGDISVSSKESVAANVSVVTGDDEITESLLPDESDVVNSDKVYTDTDETMESEENLLKDDEDLDVQETEETDYTDDFWGDDEVETTDDEAVSETLSYHIVEAGETLYQISLKYYGSGNMVNEIQKLNDIDESYSIYEGQKLILPSE